MNRLELLGDKFKREGLRFTEFIEFNKLLTKRDKDKYVKKTK